MNFTILDFILLLKNGKSDKFIQAIKKLKAEDNKTINSYDYIFNNLTKHIDYIINDWYFSKSVFIDHIDDRFPNKEYLENERQHNYSILKTVLKMLIDKDELFNIYNYFKNNFKKSNKLYTNKKKMTIGERFELQDKHDNNEIYLYYFDNFYHYRAVYNEYDQILKTLNKLCKIKIKST